MIKPVLPLLAPAFPIVVSGPSGVGKTVLCQRLLQKLPWTVRAVTATTRPPRSDERHGESYFFYTPAEFARVRDAGGFAEWAEVHRHLYGTPRTWMEQKLREGYSVVLNIDVQGGMNLRRVFDDSLLVFVLPPTWRSLERRLRHRATDSPEEIEVRMQTARAEVELVPQYDYVIVNQSLSAATVELISIVRAERARVARRLERPAEAGRRTS